MGARKDDADDVHSARDEVALIEAEAARRAADDVGLRSARAANVALRRSDAAALERERAGDTVAHRVRAGVKRE